MLTHLSTLLRALALLGIESTVAGPPGSLRRLKERLARARPTPSLTFAELPLRDGLCPADDLRAVGRLRHLLELLQPDVVHAHGHKAALAAALAAGRRDSARTGQRPALVVTVHNLLPERSRLRSSIDRRLALSGLGRASRVITVSRVLRQFVEELGPGVPVRVVPNALDPAWIPPAKGETGGEAPPVDGRVVVACVMRLHRPKGVAGLLEAASRLPGSTRAQLWIAGDGPERPSLERLAVRLGLEGRVRFLGFQPDPSRIWACAHVAALPWLREGSSYSALEAMAAGLPVVSFDGPGCREVVPEGAGVAVPPHPVDALAEALRRLAGDPALRHRMGEAARRAALSRTAADMAAETLAVYREVAQNPR